MRLEMAKFLIVFCTVIFLFYMSLGLPSLDMILATFFTLSALKFFIIYLIAAWGAFFLTCLIPIPEPLSSRVELISSICVLFILTGVVKMNYIHDHIEGKTMDHLEEHFGVEVSAESFEGKEDGTYAGTALVLYPDGSKEIRYSVVTTPYKAGRKSYNYDVDITYDLVDNKE